MRCAAAVVWMPLEALVAKLVRVCPSATVASRALAGPPRPSQRNPLDHSQEGVRMLASGHEVTGVGFKKNVANILRD